MTAMPILTQFVTDQLGEDADVVIISPDAGRVKLTRKFAQKIGAPYALLEKERPAQQVAEIGYVIGDVKDKVAVIVDDIIDTGGTLAAAAQTVLDEGAPRSTRSPPTASSPGGVRDARASPLSGSWSPTPCRCARRARHPRAHVRGHPHRLGPPHLHRRLGVRDLRRREPALLT